MGDGTGRFDKVESVISRAFQFCCDDVLDEQLCFLDWHNF